MSAGRHNPAMGGDALARLTWQDFEHLLAEHYRAQGYQVEHQNAAALKTTGAALDLRLRRGGESVLVQCKHWDAEEVQLQDVNELLGNMLHEAASRGVFITRGRFSADARSVMRRQPRLQLVDGDILRVMLKLPDHLDISLPGAPADRPAKQRKVRPASRRRRVDLASRLGPALLVLGLASLLALFVWQALLSRQDDRVPTPAASSAPRPGAASQALPVNAPIPTVAAPSSPSIPLSGASGIVSQRAGLDPPSAARELAERERLHGQSEAAREARQHEDAMKVLERNTRELGSHD